MFLSFLNETVGSKSRTLTGMTFGPDFLLLLVKGIFFMVRAADQYKWSSICSMKEITDCNLSMCLTIVYNVLIQDVLIVITFCCRFN